MSGVGKLAIGALVAGFLISVLMLPYAAAIAWTSTKVVTAVDQVEEADLTGEFPERTTMLDADGNPIAYFFTQNRVYKPLGEMSSYIKCAVISMEDRRFYDHLGVDWRSTSRALIKDFGGASTLTQQYVKNYQVLVTAKTDAERAAATAPTPIRKLREAKMAIDLTKDHTKDWVLERYLNLVGFGTRTYGVEAAAQYYFSVPASRLNLKQSALLAGMLQNPTAYNPLNSATLGDAMGRRNVVIDAMVRNGCVSEKAGEEAKSDEQSGVETSPTANGCFSATNAAEQGYYCQYVLDYLASRPENPISKEQLESGGYTIQTNLDPKAMAEAKKAVDDNANPDDDKAIRVANVIAIVEPGQNSRKVLALAANRPYGDDQDKGQTLQRLTTTFAPLGAGSIFKVFTAAAALDQGLGTSSVLKVPKTYRSVLNPSSRPINNAGDFPAELSLTGALARSPNTPFVKLEEDIGLRDVTDMAVALGLRGYDLPAGDVERSFSEMEGSYADQVVAQKMSSFTLGVTPVSPLETANVGATLASSGMWCPPSPVASISTRDGTDVPIATVACEQVVKPKLADTLAGAMLDDVSSDVGTAHAAFQAAGWDGRPVAGKTGTTQNYKSSAFLGFTPNYAAAVMTWDYQNGPRSICVDAEKINPYSCTNAEAQDGKGMGGGSVPARTWAQAIGALTAGLSGDSFPTPDLQYVQGSAGAIVPSVINLPLAEAKTILTEAGFQVSEQSISYVQNISPANTVLTQDPEGSALPGSSITLTVSSGPATSGNAGDAPATGTDTAPGTGIPALGGG